jgi:hypothetical protein
MVTGTLDVYWKKGRFTQIAQKFQRYAFYGLLLQENRLSFDSGLGITHTLMDKLSETAEWVGLFEGGTIKFTDLLTQMNVDYKHIRNHWPFDVKEKWFQSGTNEKVADVLKARDMACTLGLIQNLEETAWGVPDTAATKEMFPIAFWIVWNSSTEGFTGKYPNGFSSLAGVDLDKHDTFQNYSRIYTDPTPEDLLQDMRLLHMKTDFRSPLDVNEFRGITGQNFRIYTNDVGMLNMWGLAENRNENLGWDIGSQDNQTTFKGNMLVHVPKLDENPLASSDGTAMKDPYFFVNKENFHVVVLSQDFMRRSEPMNDRNDPDTFVNWKFLTVQTMCTNRRANGIVAAAA